MLTYFEAQAARSDLKNLLRNEHLGHGSHFEAALRQILQINGFNLHTEVLHGQFVSQLQRIKWQERGMDPDSEDEVELYLRRDSQFKHHLLPDGKKCQNRPFTPYFDNEKDKICGQRNEKSINSKNKENIPELANRLKPAGSPLLADDDHNPMGYCHQKPSVNSELKAAPVPHDEPVVPKPKKRKKRRRH